MKLKSYDGRKNRFFIGALLLFTFFSVQTSFVPNAFSLPAHLPANPGASDSVRAEFDLNFSPDFLPNREIRIVEDLYVFTDPHDPHFLEVVERLPQGGFGRILRYRGLNDRGEPADLEFVYEDEAERLTLFDHQARKFYRTTFTEKRPDPLSAFPLDRNQLDAKLLAIQIPSLKYFIKRAPDFTVALPKINWLHTQFESLFDQDLWMSRHLRGPPRGGIAP